jgi:hypothetical protein
MVAHRPCPHCELRVPRLTAKLTAKPHDTRDPQGMTMDGYTRPELRKCGRRGLAEQLTSPRVVEVPRGAACAQLRRGICSRRHQDRLAAANGLGGCLWSKRIATGPSDRPGAGSRGPWSWSVDQGGRRGWRLGLPAQGQLDHFPHARAIRQPRPPDGMWRDSRRQLGGRRCCYPRPGRGWMARRELTAMKPLPTSNLHQHDRQRRTVRMLIDHRQART